MLLLLGKLLVALALLARIFWRPRRSREMIYHWASQHRYKVLAMRQCRLLRGPFVTTKEQAVYKVVMKVEGNKRRTAYIACGSPLLGLGSHDMIVSWAT